MTDKRAKDADAPHATGRGTAPAHDVADPHPAAEEHYDRERRPGGANPPRKDIGPNPDRHDGRPGSHDAKR